VVAQSKEPKNQKRGKYIECKYHFIKEIVSRGDAVMEKIASIKNVVDPFTKTLPQKTFESHLKGMGVRCLPN
jgi:hypothetical protein